MDYDDTQSKHMAHTMDRLIVGCSPTSNAIMVYNPQNQQYYEPDSYRIDSYWLPASVYPTLKYAAGYFVLCYGTTIPCLKRNILPVLVWNALTHLQTCCYWVRLLISPSQVRFLMTSLTFTTPFSLTMVLLHLFLSQKRHQLFLLLQSTLLLLTLRTPTSPHFFI
jgi:hypothetical protein